MRDSLEMMPFRCHKQLLDMTKTELQVALGAATETNKRTAGVFLETLSALAYKEIKKNGDHYQVIVQISPKYRGSFNTLAFAEIKPQSGSLNLRMAGLTWSTIKIPALT